MSQPHHSRRDVLKLLGSVPLVAAAGTTSMVTANQGATPKKARLCLVSRHLQWAGIEEGSQHLRTVAEDVENLLEPAGFERETRPYVPHLTLGRTRSRRATLDTSEISPPALRFTVSGVDLVMSTPGKNGVTYSILATYPL